MKKYLIILLLIPVSAFGAETFYVCAGGDGTLPETNTCATAWDWDDVDNTNNWAATEADDTKIGPNDTVIFKDDGGTFNLSSDIDTYQAGSSGSVITFIAESGDTPTITAGTSLTGWTVYSGNVYSKSTGNIESTGLYEDGVVLNEEMSAGAVDAAGEWHCDESTTYVWTTDDADPDTHTMTTSAITWLMSIKHSYIIVDGLKFSDHYEPMVINSGADNVTVQNCTFEDVYFTAIQVADGSGSNNLNLSDNVFTRVGMGGIYVYSQNDTGIANGNVCTDMNYQEWAVNANNTTNSDGHCVAIWGSDSWTIHENKVVDFRDAFALYGHNATTHTAANNSIKYNYIQGSAALKSHYDGGSYGKGITIGSTSQPDEHYSNVVAYNIIDQAHIGMRINRSNTSGKGNLVYNNTFYDCDRGLDLRQEADYNVVKNNIFSETDSYHIYEYSGTTGANLVSDENQFYPDTGGSAAPDFADSGSDKDQLSDWQTSTSQDANSDAGDPGLTNPSSGDFTLSSDLEGADLGATYDDGLDPINTNWTNTPPTIGTLDQDDYLPWDRGAFIFAEEEITIQGVTVY